MGPPTGKGVISKVDSGISKGDSDVEREGMPGMRKERPRPEKNSGRMREQEEPKNQRQRAGRDVSTAMGWLLAVS